MKRLSLVRKRSSLGKVWARRCYGSLAVPTHKDIVIGGGGVTGCSVAFHLAKKGFQPLLLEQNQYGAGTTWHAAGLVGQLRGGKTETLHGGVYGCDLYESFEQDAELDISAGFKRCGAITLITTKEREVMSKRACDRANCWGVEARMITPGEVQDLDPLLNVDDLMGGLYIPGDGAISASDTCNSYIKAGKHHGAEFMERVRILDVIPKNQGKDGFIVVTDKGDIETKYFINAGGQWARQLAAKSGVVVPLFSTEHYYVVTKNLGVQRMNPVIRDLDSYLYFREWSGGLLGGVFELDGKAAFKDGNVPHNFEFSLLDQDWEHFMPAMENICKRYPVFEEAEVQLINGPESFTPDMMYIMGEANQLHNYFIAAGMNSSGIASSGGMGRAIADWIENDFCPQDLTSIDCRRIQWMDANMSYCRSRAVEALGRHYKIHFPGMEWESGRGVRRSPIYSDLKKRGAVMIAKAGHERPGWFCTDPNEEPVNKYSFTDPNWMEYTKKECEGTRNAVALFDTSSFGKLMVVGSDAERELQRICANDISGPVGKITYTQVLNPIGTIEGDVTVQKISDTEFYWVTSAASTLRDEKWIRKMAQGNCYAVDVTSGYGVLAVMGPNSRKLLEAVSRPGQRFDNEAFPFGTFQDIDVGFARTRAARITYVGELGWELHTSSDQIQHVYETLLEAGDEFGLINGGYNCIESLRMEKGYRGFAHEITPGEDPLMAGLGFAVKFEKDFIGKQALLKLKEQGLYKRLCQFKLSKHPEIRLWGGEPLLLNGTYCGYLTSATTSWTFGGCGIGMGYVNDKAGNSKITKKFLDANKDNFEVEVERVRYPVEVCLSPLFDPKGLRVKGNYN